jgi:hypothetical protein
LLARTCERTTRLDPAVWPEEDIMSEDSIGPGPFRLGIPRSLRRLSLVASLALGGVLMSGSAASAAVVYDNIPSPLPGNLVSQAYQAQQTGEFGGQGRLAGTQRQDPTVTATMSSWGCESVPAGVCTTTPGSTFSHPITLNLYGVLPNGEPGGQIASVTKTFDIPFRPSAEPACGAGGQWSPNAGVDCFNGFANNIAFDLAGRGVSLPDRVIVALAYNTTSYGEAPMGTGAACFSTPQGCGYDSLNWGFADDPPSVGTLPRPDDAYWDTMTASSYCDGGAGGTGVFRLDKATTSPACNWTGYQPAVRLDATATSGPTGPAGPAGPAGPKGETGSTGPAGPAGGVAGVVGGSKKRSCKRFKSKAKRKKCSKQKR